MKIHAFVVIILLCFSSGCLQMDDKNPSEDEENNQDDLIILALKGADQELKDKLFGCMSQRAAANKPKTVESAVADIVRPEEPKTRRQPSKRSKNYRGRSRRPVKMTRSSRGRGRG